MASLTFLGAAGTVTGSKHLLEADGRRVLVDCGLYQGPRELRRRNWEPLPVEPGSIDAVVLTHAHIDHTGYLPRLVRDGFEGPILATSATVDLLEILLADSGKLQEEEAEYRNRKGKTRFDPALPLYTAAEGVAAARRATGVGFEEPVEPVPGVEVRFRPAGHILGAAFLDVRLDDGTRLAFSGDVGRWDVPILPDPAPIGPADVVVSEATYGDRLHPDAPIDDQLEAAVGRVVDRGGALVVPAFAIGRTQLLMVHLKRLEEAGRIPCLPTYVDSPMAIAASEVYSRHPEAFDDRAWQEATGGGLECGDVRLARTPEESKAINEVEGPLTIIAGSGMVTGGRVLHHLRRRLGDSRTTVLLVGFQAPGTRGRELLEGAETVRIFGDEIPVRATVETVSGMSAHADADELVRWLGTVEGRPRACYLVHAEPPASAALAERLRDELGWEVVVPEAGQTIDASTETGAGGS